MRKILRELLTCSKHTSECVAFVCCEHNEVLCNMCSMTEHRKCESFETIEKLVRRGNPEVNSDAVKDRVSTDKDDIGQPTLNKLDVVLGKMENCKEYVKLQKNELELEEKRKKECLNSVQQLLEELFSVLEKQTLAQLNYALETINTLDNNIATTVRTLKTKQTILSDIGKYAQNTHVFLQCCKLNDFLKKMEDGVTTYGAVAKSKTKMPAVSVEGLMNETVDHFSKLLSLK
ncbi:hypothetical protein DPMN_059703 [Dreissena polymorpha]|uniref:B box-type domain-containing protein n=1 Tax=Dreissena polymorpha TaxID=45954 RepID=A0A9D4C3Z1_DREPO|nr:hypothetical protein DPMN_059703 [Dreissena polymorpha]